MYLMFAQVWPQGLSNTLPVPLVVPVMAKSESSGSVHLIGSSLQPAAAHTNDNITTDVVPYDGEMQHSNVHISLNYDASTSSQFVKQWPAVVCTILFWFSFVYFEILT